MSGYRASTINMQLSYAHNVTWHAVFFGLQTIAENDQWSQIFSSSQCMDRQSALDTGTTNKHSHQRANHTHPLSQPRFRGDAMLPDFRAGVTVQMDIHHFVLSDSMPHFVQAVS